MHLTSPPKGGTLCMKGGIYACDGQKCPICGSSFKDNGRNALVCPNHPNQKATRFQVKFGKICHRFKSYEAASRFLTGLRYKTDEGSFDERDYRKDLPLSFQNLAEKWLRVKKESVRPKTYRNLRNDIGKAIACWGHRNIKEIGYAEIEDFILEQNVSQKTRHNICSCLHDFWTWLLKRRVIKLHEFPEFPEIKYELRYRRVIDKETQERVLDEIWRISHKVNPKIWLGIKWLCTYISIRPGELIKINEEHIDLKNGYLFIPTPKEKKAKNVPLIEEDIKILEALPRGFPKMPFFRHEKGNGAAKPGSRFGKDYLYKWWKRACKNLGIEGVDLYGGTRHSSAMALRKYRTPEEIKRATMHSTNKAFERYFQIEGDELRKIYADSKPSGAPAKIFKIPG